MWSIHILLMLQAASTQCVSDYTQAARHDAERVASIIASQPESPVNKLLMPLAAIESNLNQDALSLAGARGLLQVTPIAEKHVLMFHGNRPRIRGGRDWSKSSVNSLYDPEYNVKIGSAYLRYCWDIAGSLTPRRQVEGALACYNGGPRQLQNLRASRALAPETWGYIRKVLQLSRRCGIMVPGATNNK